MSVKSGCVKERETVCGARDRKEGDKQTNKQTEGERERNKVGWEDVQFCATSSSLERGRREKRGGSQALCVERRCLETAYTHITHTHTLSMHDIRDGPCHVFIHFIGITTHTHSFT